MARFSWKDIAKAGASALAERARQEREEREREERERLAREKTEARLAQEARARAERERLAREREAAREAKAQAEREEREREEREREAREAEEQRRAEAEQEARQPAPGPPLEIFVAPRGSAALTAAEQKKQSWSGEGEVRVERKLFRAFAAAAAALNEPGDRLVTLRIAEGRYTGKARTGTWLVPKIEAPGSTLRILGGYGEDWDRRDPFTRSTRLAVAADRTAPILQFEKNSRVRELYLSGLTLDAGPSNTYGQDEQLQTGQSNAYELVALSYLETERLVIADNLFVNAGHRVMETLVRAASGEMEIVVRNNMVMNSVMAWRAFSAKAAHQPKRYLFENNSFLVNWPHNPDRTTSNPGALEIGDKYSAGRVELRRNLFAFNVGGAIHAGSEGAHGPNMVMEENLFWGNGALFGVEDPGQAAVVGKFNRSRQYIPLSPDEVEDDFDWQVAGNVALDPGLRVQVKEFEGFSSVGEMGSATVAAVSEVSAETLGAASDRASGAQTLALASEVASMEDRGEEQDLEADAGEEASGESAGGRFDLGESEFSFDLGEDDFSTESGGGAESSDLEGEDDLGLDLGGGGLFQDLSIEGDLFESKGFAPRLFVDGPERPFPTHEAARAYGAHPDLVEQL